MMLWKKIDSRAAYGAARLMPGVLVLLIGSVVFVLDQWSKSVALRTLAEGPVAVIGDWVRFRLVFNPGAAFSVGESITPVFTVFQAVVGLGVFVAAWRLRSMWWAVTLGLVFGGATGNLFDRLWRPPSFGYGHVVDFISVGSFPVFNVADSAITVAAVMIFVAAVAGWEAFSVAAPQEGDMKFGEAMSGQERE
ncbi:signal peptidase II [Dermatophilus congolensis]|nr:signal peptidase II [Dermatophilus congolensis]MBO3132432.1 signal peptidase II [Dermatophilus congolensis]MBO3133407.1 signal peptidase II [Dermatophilus congolensis]MBO3135642.1 signal peptidase II [Dermatophilus congolensis]MBO3137881.1 signal peptidase II [Dermatophilus congolensis]